MSNTRNAQLTPNQNLQIGDEWLDVISIDGIRAKGKHGVTEAEREKCMPLEISVTLRADLSRSAHSDDIGDTINYSKLHDQIVKVVENNSRHLLERLANDIVESVLADARVKTIQVTIAKPERLNGATPRVTLTRRNSV